MAIAQKQFSDPDMGPMPNVNATGLNQAAGGRQMPGASQYYSALNQQAPQRALPKAPVQPSLPKGVPAIKPAKPVQSVAKPAIKNAPKPARAPVKVDTKGNIVNQGGRPKQARGTSDGHMIIRNGGK
jgi:hypothetical protein